MSHHSPGNGFELSDEQFFKLIHQAVEKASRHYWPPLRPDEIEDIRQKICLDLINDDYHGLNSFDPQKATLKTWLRRVAHNKVFQHWLGQKDDQSLEDIDSNSLVSRST